MNTPPAALAVIAATVHDWLELDNPGVADLTGRIAVALDLAGYEIRPRPPAPPDPSHRPATH